DVLEQADPYRQSGANPNLTLRAMMDRARERLDKNTELPPLTEAAIRLTAGRFYWTEGEYKTAERQLARAYALLVQHAGEDAPDTLAAGYHLGVTYQHLSDFARAEPLLLRVLEGRRRRHGDDHPETLWAVFSLATLYSFRGENERAEPLFVQALEAA